MPIREKNKKNRKPDEADIEAAGHTESAPNDTPANELEQLQQQNGELLEKYQRALADYRNYQTRALSNEREARTQGEASVLASVVRVLDHFELALQQDPAKASVDQILGGVKMIRDELLRAVAAHGATTIEPNPNDAFNPEHHEAVQQMPAENIDPGNIVALAQTGYAHGPRVLRPAKVVVAPPSPDEEDPPANNPSDCCTNDGPCGCNTPNNDPQP